MESNLYKDRVMRNLWANNVAKLSREEETTLVQWLEEEKMTSNQENALTLIEDELDLQQDEQLILHFINPKLRTFPRGFAQIVADTHEKFNLTKMEKIDIKRENGSHIRLYLSRNKFGCKFIHVESSREVFLEDLGGLLRCLREVKMNKKK